MKIFVGSSCSIRTDQQAAFTLLDVVLRDQWSLVLYHQIFFICLFFLSQYSIKLCFFSFILYISVVNSSSVDSKCIFFSHFCKAVKVKRSFCVFIFVASYHLLFGPAWNNNCARQP